jgi:hypothetical protein
MTATNITKLVIAFLLFLCWGLLVIFRIAGAEDLITWIKISIGGLGLYHLHNRVGVARVASVAQAGFARLPMLLMLATAGLFCMSLTGCASWVQAASAYNTSGMVSARAAEDLNVKIWTENACGTPLSTIVRHPEIAGGLKALCLTPSSGSASDVLGAIPAAPSTSTGAATAPPAPSASAAPASATVSK